MGKSIYPTEAKAIILLLTARIELAGEVLQEFVRHLGPIEWQGEWHPFPSDYYQAEVGKNPKRCLIGFKNIFTPERLPELKQLATKLEGKERAINIDPGYVDLFKVVLASGKGGGMKTALTAEAYAYPLLRYEKGSWLPFPWTYPDFQSPVYHEGLRVLRERLAEQLSHRS